MRNVKHDDIKSGADLQGQGGAGPRGTIRRLGGWVSRAVGRGCAGGLWTLSPDGKLHCELLRTEDGECN